jgi:hypothetical protein
MTVECTFVVEADFSVFLVSFSFLSSLGGGAAALTGRGVASFGGSFDEAAADFARLAGGASSSSV